MGLFISVSDLKERLRLSRVPDASGATELLQEASLVVRLGFLENLGETRVTDILGTAFTETPLSSDEQARALAHSLEVKWTRYELTYTLPMLFADGNNDNGQIFHDEAAFRRMQQDQLEALRTSLWDEIQVGLSRLEASTEAEARNTVRFAAITPDIAPPIPGDTARPPSRYPNWCCEVCGHSYICCTC